MSWVLGASGGEEELKCPGAHAGDGGGAARRPEADQPVATEGSSSKASGAVRGVGCRRSESLGRDCH